MKPILLDLPLPIETPRLLLRAPLIGEGEILLEAVLESFELLNKFMLWAKNKPTLNESEEIVRQAVANWILKKNERPYLMFFIIDKGSNQFVGWADYHYIDWDVPCLESGYWVRKKYTGNGFITEAINALTQYAFKQLGVKRMAIACDPENIRSKKIPEKLGYHLESIIKVNRLQPITGEVADTLVYARYDLNELPELEVYW